MARGARTWLLAHLRWGLFDLGAQTSAGWRTTSGQHIAAHRGALDRSSHGGWRDSDPAAANGATSRTFGSGIGRLVSEALLISRSNRLFMRESAFCHRGVFFGALRTRTIGKRQKRKRRRPRQRIRMQRNRISRAGGRERHSRRNTRTQRTAVRTPHPRIVQLCALPMGRAVMRTRIATITEGVI